MKAFVPSSYRTNDLRQPPPYQQTGGNIERHREADLSLSQSPEHFIGHYERNPGLGVCGALVDFGFVLYVDCPGRLDAFPVFDLEFEYRVCLDAPVLLRE